MYATLQPSCASSLLSSHHTTTFTQSTSGHNGERKFFNMFLCYIYSKLSSISAPLYTSAFTWNKYTDHFNNAVYNAYRFLFIKSNLMTLHSPLSFIFALLLFSKVKQFGHVPECDTTTTFVYFMWAFRNIYNSYTQAYNIILLLIHKQLLIIYISI